MKKLFLKNFNRKKTALALKIVAVVIAVVLLLYSLFVVWDMFGFESGDGTESMVRIPEGSSITDIAHVLAEEGVIKHPMMFRLYEKLSGDHMFRQGVHRVGTGMSYAEILKKLTASPEADINKTVTVLIPEGYEAHMIAEKLEELGLASKDRFMEELDKGEFDFDFIDKIDRKENRLEGYLFPATYEILLGESEHDIIEKMLTAFDKRIVPLYESTESVYTLDEIVTMASIVEREAANDSERGKVASVFYNRLDRDMAFGSCATVQYVLKERKTVLSNADTKIKSPYNTYIHKGLPIGPIASPGESSVKAALFPDETDYLYFVAKADGSENVFTRTLEEHNAMTKQLQSN